MTLGKKIMAGALAGLALLATTAAAFAAPAYATGNVNVRSGPGTYYGKVDTLQRGERVNVLECQGSWCFVEKSGPDGWVSANYLSRAGNGGGWQDDDWGWDRPPHWNPPPRPPRPPHWNPPPRPAPWPQPQPWPGNGGNNGGSVCFNGPNGYFCIGN